MVPASGALNHTLPATLSGTGLGDAQSGLARPRGDLLADTPVNALAQQVCVSVVAGVLLDHVHEQLPQ